MRVFQNYATLDLVSNGRAEIIAGRGSFTEAFESFGYKMEQYDELFEEKLELLIEIQKNKNVTWRGDFRAPLINQFIYPRPFSHHYLYGLVLEELTIFFKSRYFRNSTNDSCYWWRTHRFKPLVDMYREAEEGLTLPENLKVDCT